MTADHVLVESDGSIGVITLNRPQVLNALNQALMHEVADAMEAFERDTAIRCIVVTGRGRAFAAGADVREFADATPVDMVQSYRFQQWERIRRIGKPLIAAVNGYAFGGGCELAMACDIIIASETARFGQPEIRLGLIPGAGGAVSVTRRIGRWRTAYLVLSGRTVTAAIALGWGLVDAVAESHAPVRPQ